MAAALFPLLVTLAVEIPCVALLFPGQRLRMALVCAVTTGATNFLMNTVLFAAAPSQLTFLLVGELGALVVEGVVYALASKPRDVRRAVAASLVANAASFGAGIVLTHVH